MSNEDKRATGAMIPGRPFRRGWKVWTGIASTLLVSGIVAAVLIFEHSAPNVPAIGMETTCASLAANPATVIVGSSGSLLLTCGGAAAFSIVTGSVSTPAFALPNGYASLWVFPHASPPAPGTSCSTAGMRILSGTAIAWSGNDAWSYCAQYASVPASGLAAFTVSWST